LQKWKIKKKTRQVYIYYNAGGDDNDYNPSNYNIVIPAFVKADMIVNACHPADYNFISCLKFHYPYRWDGDHWSVVRNLKILQIFENQSAENK
jgi:hypothetical protein